MAPKFGLQDSGLIDSIITGLASIAMLKWVVGGIGVCLLLAAKLIMSQRGELSKLQERSENQARLLDRMDKKLDRLLERQK